MSLPKEPRQLMINLMYLVLTALLAMNVSSEILNAFKIVDKSINRSSENLSQKSSATLAAFEVDINDPKIKGNVEKLKKITDFKALAEQAAAKRKDVEARLAEYREMIIKRAGGMDPNSPGNLLREDDLDAATAVMIEDDKKGKEMLDLLQKYKSEMAALVPLGNDILSMSTKNESLEKMLPLNFEVDKSESNKSGDWSYGNFHMVPAVGAITIMDKYINDVRNTESMVIDELWAKAFGEKTTKVIPLPDYALLVSSPNTYLLPGEKYTANIMLGAYNKTSNNLTIRVNGQTLAVKEGVATYTATANGKGEQKLQISGSFVDPNDGTVRNYTIPASYYVGEAQATISLDKMNVFYIGVDNPITFAASGIPAGSLSYTTENCTLTPAPGVNKFNVRVTTAGKARISLTGKLGDGTTKSFGTNEYRVKRIPDPYPLVANSKGGAICASQLKVQIAVFAKLDGFDFDCKFDVLSFDMFYQPKRGENKEASSRSMYLTGPNADPAVKDIMNSLKPGDRLYIENIKARGCDGQTRSIGTINFVINC